MTVYVVRYEGMKGRKGPIELIRTNQKNFNQKLKDFYYVGVAAYALTEYEERELNEKGKIYVTFSRFTTRGCASYLKDLASQKYGYKKIGAKKETRYLTCESAEIKHREFVAGEKYEVVRTEKNYAYVVNGIGNAVPIDLKVMRYPLRLFNEEKTSYAYFSFSD